VLLPPLPLARTVTEIPIGHQHSLHCPATGSDIVVNRQIGDGFREKRLDQFRKGVSREAAE